MHGFGAPVVLPFGMMVGLICRLWINNRFVAKRGMLPNDSGGLCVGLGFKRMGESRFPALARGSL